MILPLCSVGSSQSSSSSRASLPVAGQWRIHAKDSIKSRSGKYPYLSLKSAQTEPGQLQSPMRIATGPRRALFSSIWLPKMKVSPPVQVWSPVAEVHAGGEDVGEET